MRGILLLNGEAYEGEIDADGAKVYCCDGAYRWAHGKVKIDVNLGDFDSLDITPDPPPDTVYPAEKNYTDGELALRRAIDEGCDEIEIYGGGGGREDHFLGNLHLLYLGTKLGARCRMITNRSEIFCIDGEFTLTGRKGATLSVLPFGGRVEIVKSRGLYYPLPKEFVYGSTRGISNIATENEVQIVTKGMTLVIVDFGVV